MIDRPNETLPGNVFGWLRQAAQDPGVRIDPHVALEYWWDLARSGAIALMGSQSSGEVPSFLVTRRGRQMLEGAAPGPHDRDGFLARVRAQADGLESVDSVALAYLAEGHNAWLAGLPRATVVMVGVACERLVHLLAERVAEVPSALAASAPKVKKQLAEMDTGKFVTVSGLYEDVIAALNELRAAKKLPKLKDALERRVSAIFDHARALRNRSGHPTGDEVSADEAHAALLLYPGFYRLVLELRAALGALVPTPPA